MSISLNLGIPIIIVLSEYDDMQISSPLIERIYKFLITLSFANPNCYCHIAISRYAVLAPI